MNARCIYIFLCKDIDFLFPIILAQENSDGVKQSCKLAVVDGVSHKIRTCEYFEPGDVDELPALSEEITEKFKNSPPNAEELGKLLQDFVIFQDFVENSTSNYTSFNLLLISFKEAKKFGPFTLEDDTINDNFQANSAR